MDKLKCVLCPKIFSRQYCLERQIDSVHKGTKRKLASVQNVNSKKVKKSYHCDICGKEVRDNWVLKRHMKIH